MLRHALILIAQTAGPVLSWQFLLGFHIAETNKYHHHTILSTCMDAGTKILWVEPLACFALRCLSVAQEGHKTWQPWRHFHQYLLLQLQCQSSKQLLLQRLQEIFRISSLKLSNQLEILLKALLLSFSPEILQPKHPQNLARESSSVSCGIYLLSRKSCVVASACSVKCHKTDQIWTLEVLAHWYYANISCNDQFCCLRLSCGDVHDPLLLELCS